MSNRKLLPKTFRLTAGGVGIEGVTAIGSGTIVISTIGDNFVYDENNIGDGIGIYGGPITAQSFLSLAKEANLAKKGILSVRHGKKAVDDFEGYYILTSLYDLSPEPKEEDKNKNHAIIFIENDGHVYQDYESNALNNQGVIERWANL